MGFFSLLETFFFLSLGITFVLIIMLVYHFKGRLVALEEKYHTMFDIMNSMVKEMKNLRDTMMAIQYQPPVQVQEQMPPSFPIDFMKLFQGGGPQLFPSQRQYDEDDEDDETQEYKKIVVSDTELDSDDEDDTDIKIISVDIGEAEESISLADLDEDENLVNQLDADDQDQGEPQEPQEQEDQEAEQDEDKQESQEPMDLKKMDVSYLRTMVLTRGLATDTKRMKKNDLIKLLEQSTESIE